MDPAQRLELTDEERLTIAGASHRLPRERLPIVGGWLLSRRWWREVTPIVRRIEATLVAREEPDPAVWGEDPERGEIAQVVLGVAMRVIGWPNARFYPHDSAYLPFWAYAEAGDVLRAFEEIGQSLGMSMGTQELIELFTRYWIEQPPLEDLVVYLQMRRHGQ
jgi:hypothetical protein